MLASGRVQAWYCQLLEFLMESYCGRWSIVTLKKLLGMFVPRPVARCINQKDSIYLHHSLPHSVPASAFPAPASGPHGMRRKAVV